MSSPSLIAVAGPSGSGKTTWISQYLRQPTTPTYYLCPGLGNASVDQAIINYRFPSVQIIPDTEAQTVLSKLSEEFDTVSIRFIPTLVRIKEGERDRLSF